MRSASRVLVTCLLVVSACSQEFTGIDESSDAGAGGSSKAGSTGSGGKPSGTAGRGGSKTTGGSSSATGGTGVEPGAGGSLAGTLGLGGVIGVGGSGGAEPARIPEDGLELWLRADVGVVHEDGVVGAWKDSSRHGRDASQSAANQRPVLTEGVLGNHPALLFDGNDYLALPALSIDFSAGVSIFVAGREDKEVECQAFFEASNGRETDDLHLGSWMSAPIYEVMMPFLHAVDFPIVPTAPQILAAIHQPNGVVRMRRNTNGLGEHNFALPEKLTRSEVFVGHSLYDKCTPLAGVVAELLVYSRSVSTEEVTQIESYLQKKWSCCEP